MDIKLVLAITIFALIKVVSANDTVISQSGDNFELSVLQTTGDNYLQGTATGEGNSITANQSGSASATFNLQNSGGAVDLSITQNDASDSVSVTKICTDPAGCSISIDQR